MNKFKNTFYGQPISEEGKRRGYVDYKAFASAFNHIIANTLFEKIICEDENVEFYNYEADEYGNDPEVYQWYLIDDYGIEICDDFNEIMVSSAKYGVTFWGVTHYGTSWDYVMTNIPCETEE